MPNDWGADYYNNHSYYTCSMERTTRGWKVASVVVGVTLSVGNPVLFDMSG